MESDEERAARVGTREKEHARARARAPAREVERERERERERKRGEKRKSGRAKRARDVGEDRKRKRETETDSVLDPPGIDAFVCQNAETPASFLPSFSLLCSSLPPPAILLVRRFPSFSLSHPLSLSLSLSLSLPLPASVSFSSLSLFSVSIRPALSFFPSRSLLPASFVLRAFTSCC